MHVPKKIGVIVNNETHICLDWSITRDFKPLVPFQLQSYSRFVGKNVTPCSAYKVRMENTELITKIDVHQKKIKAHCELLELPIEESTLLVIHYRVALPTTFFWFCLFCSC